MSHDFCLPANEQVKKHQLLNCPVFLVCVYLILYCFFISPIATLPQCDSGVDLFFVIDSTGTLGTNGHATMREWAANLVDKLTIGTNEDEILDGLTRVEVIQFWGEGFLRTDPMSKTSVDIKLGEYINKTDLKQRIRNLVYQNGRSTIIPHGLKTLYKEIANNTQRTIYALVLTDGIDDSISPTALEEEANKLKEMQNVNVFAIGFGNRNNANLNKIASQQDNVIASDILDGALNETYHRMITSVCPS